MPPDRTRTVRTLGLVALAGVLLGAVAQFLRQTSGAWMALGGSTAPWLTAGYVLSLRATRREGLRLRRNVLGIAAIAVYLVAWLITYHLLFTLREGVTLYEGWLEARVWLLLTVPASIFLGVAAASAHKNDFVGDLCLALPIAWSTPEAVVYSIEGWAYAVIAALPTVASAIAPILAVARWRRVRLPRVLIACVGFALLGLALLPRLRNLIDA